MERLDLRPPASERRGAVKSPVALFMFRRPDTTERVLDAIRQARPPLLLVVADGPRQGRPDDAPACAATRALIDRIDWPCDVRREFAGENMGCRNRVSSGLAWVFQQVPEAIILEDDCVPDASFFPYCDEMLERYRDDHRVAQISGSNNQKGRRRGTHSYFFSRYHNVWGWASWRRAFDLYDVEMRRWPELRDSGWLLGLLGNRTVAHYWKRQFQATYERRIDTWDYQWIYSTWLHGMVSAVPNRNLVRNIGFGPGASHTPVHDPFADDTLERMDFPLDHPPTVARDTRADRFTEQFEFVGGPLARLRHALRTRVIAPLKQRMRLALRIPQTLTFPSFTIELPADHLLPAMLRAYPRYDRFLPHLAKHLDAGDVAIDVGANCGDTLAAMASANPALSFVCIEPDAKFFGFLSRNARRISAALPGTSVRLVRALVGAKQQASVLHGDGGTKAAHAAGERAKPAEEIHRATRLDDIVAREALTPGRVRLLKSDVDGCDFDVLASAGALLENPRLLVFFECYAVNDGQRAGYIDLFTRLDERGYHHFSFFDNFGNFIRHVTTAEPGAIRAQLDEAWLEPPSGATGKIFYLDVLACRDADAAFIRRVVTEFQAA